MFQIKLYFVSLFLHSISSICYESYYTLHYIGMIFYCSAIYCTLNLTHLQVIVLSPFILFSLGSRGTRNCLSSGRNLCIRYFYWSAVFCKGNFLIIILIIPMRIVFTNDLSMYYNHIEFLTNRQSLMFYFS